MHYAKRAKWLSKSMNAHECIMTFTKRKSVSSKSLAMCFMSPDSLKSFSIALDDNLFDFFGFSYETESGGFLVAAVGLDLHPKLPKTDAYVRMKLDVSGWSIESVSNVLNITLIFQKLSENWELMKLNQNSYFKGFFVLNIE